MNKPFKPMLASPVDFEKLDFSDGILVSPKLDGIRCLIIDGVAVTRSLKPIRNKYVQSILGRPELNGLDGELIVGSPVDPNVYQITNSGVMSGDGAPNFMFYVFDHFGHPELPYMEGDGEKVGVDRYAEMFDTVQMQESPQYEFMTITRSRTAYSLEQLLQIEAEYLEQGYEGVMLRRPSAPYKFGRASASKKEQHLLKLKRFEDAEARIIGFNCLFSNQNEATKDNLGYTERSTAKEGLVVQDTLGALHVRNLADGVDFYIGSGYTAAQRKQIWDSRHDLLGKIVKYKHFAIGVVDKPRFPIFLGFRETEDMS